MKGLILEFLFLTVVADRLFFGIVWPVIRRHFIEEKPVDLEVAKATRSHVITYWNDHGTGRGDDANGWRCSCGLFRIGNSGIEQHLDFIKTIDQANSEIQRMGTNESTL